MLRTKKLVTNKRILVNVCNLCGFRKAVGEETYTCLYKTGTHESDKEIECEECDECTVCLPNKIQRDWLQRILLRIESGLESRIDSLESRLNRLNDI